MKRLFIIAFYFTCSIFLFTSCAKPSKLDSKPEISLTNSYHTIIDFDSIKDPEDNFSMFTFSFRVQNGTLYKKGFLSFLYIPSDSPYRNFNVPNLSTLIKPKEAEVGNLDVLIDARSLPHPDSTKIDSIYFNVRLFTDDSTQSNTVSAGPIILKN